MTLQLLTTDSAFVGGAVSDEDGKFAITAPKNDKYLLKISSVGYITTLKRIEMVEDHDLAMGQVVLEFRDAIMLKGTEVTALAQKVVLREDTLLCITRRPIACRRVRWPKMVANDCRAHRSMTVDGKITINGKQVKKKSRSMVAKV